MQRIAAPMVGGMITAPLLSMFVIPAAYFLMRRPREQSPLRLALLEGIVLRQLKSVCDVHQPGASVSLNQPSKGIEMKKMSRTSYRVCAAGACDASICAAENGRHEGHGHG